MKMVMVAYNEAMEEEVMEALDACALKDYTKVPGAFGRGSSSGAHLGSDVWPGRNNILYVACDEAKAKVLLAGVKELRAKLGREGIKAFVLPVEDLT